MAADVPGNAFSWTAQAGSRDAHPTLKHPHCHPGLWAGSAAAGTKAPAPWLSPSAAAGCTVRARMQPRLAELAGSAWHRAGCYWLAGSSHDSWLHTVYLHPHMSHIPRAINLHGCLYQLNSPAATAVSSLLADKAMGPWKPGIQYSFPEILRNPNSESQDFHYHQVKLWNWLESFCCLTTH